MHQSDQEAIGWYEQNRDEFVRGARQVLRKYIEIERSHKKAGRARWWESWSWSEAVSDVISRPRTSALVLRTEKQLKEQVKPWRLEDYDELEKFDRLVDRFEDAFRGAY